MKMKKLQITGVEITVDLIASKYRKAQLNMIKTSLEFKMDIVVRKDQAVLNELTHSLSTTQLRPWGRALW